jgi:hypothetical protein
LDITAFILYAFQYIIDNKKNLQIYVHFN